MRTGKIRVREKPHSGDGKKFGASFSESVNIIHNLIFHLSQVSTLFLIPPKMQENMVFLSFHG